ncbi:hypothetical protein CD113_04090 [Staphylococcus simiae]|nr:hypothetical protein CD113_04090 [Staphylococcus simiae]
MSCLTYHMLLLEIKRLLIQIYLMFLGLSSSHSLLCITCNFYSIDNNYHCQVVFYIFLIKYINFIFFICMVL